MLFQSQMAASFMTMTSPLSYRLLHQLPCINLQLKLPLAAAQTQGVLLRVTEQLLQLQDQMACLS